MRLILIISLCISYVASSQTVADTLIYIQPSGDTVKVVTYRNAATTTTPTTTRLRDSMAVVRALIPDVSGLVTTSAMNDALAGKQNALGFTPLDPSNNLSEVTPATARNNLGLGTLATQSGTFSGTSSGTNTGDNATNSQYSGLAATKQDALVSGSNIKTINGSSVLGSGDLVVSGAVAANTSGVGNSPTSSSTQTITHNLGRVPSVIRIYGYGTFTSNAAATTTTSSIGVFTSSGNFCVYQRYGAAITTTQAGLSSNTFSILLATGGGSFISGVIQNVTSTQFDIVWTETGTATAQVFLWEAQ